jgi:hypothetical protein
MAKGNEPRTIYCCACLTCQQQPNSPTAHEHRDINRLIAATDERSRRLFVGFLASQYGRGGIALLARITGLDRNTIARGKRDLRRPALSAGRIRRPGAGRPRAEKKAQGF